MLIATILLHSLTALLGLYLFILFVWWWRKRCSSLHITVHIADDWLKKQTPKYHYLKFIWYCVLFMWEHFMSWQRSATKIYNYTTGLMFGIFLGHLGAVWVYVNHAKIHPELLFEFMPDWWPLRQIFMLAPLAMYAKHATVKIINENKAAKQLAFEEERRRIRRRSMDQQNGVIK